MLGLLSLLSDRQRLLRSHFSELRLRTNADDHRYLRDVQFPFGDQKDDMLLEGRARSEKAERN